MKRPCKDRLISATTQTEADIPVAGDDDIHEAIFLKVSSSLPLAVLAVTVRNQHGKPRKKGFKRKQTQNGEGKGERVSEGLHKGLFIQRPM